jgi:hypothetical protein
MKKLFTILHTEIRLIEEGSKICDLMMEGMLRVLRPGMYETQVYSGVMLSLMTVLHGTSMREEIFCDYSSGHYNG